MSKETAHSRFTYTECQCEANQAQVPSFCQCRRICSCERCATRNFGRFLQQSTASKQVLVFTMKRYPSGPFGLRERMVTFSHKILRGTEANQRRVLGKQAVGSGRQG